MKRSEAIKSLIKFVIPKTEIISQQNYESGIYHNRASVLLDFIEKELGMLPPFNENNKDFASKRDTEGYCWELEDV